MSENSTKSIVAPDKDAIRQRYETLLLLFEQEYMPGICEELRGSIALSKELLHCAVNAYFDDIYRYKQYAGSTYADRHKQAAFTMIWISRFKPIQIKSKEIVNKALLTVNETYAIFAGFMFLDPVVMDRMTERFFNHLVYILTYRQIDGRALASMIYLMEVAAKNDVKY